MSGGHLGDSDTDESCVEMAEIPGSFAIRDFKDPGRPALRFTAEELDSFVRGYATARGII